MASIINASPTNGIVQTADGSGVLKIQSNSVTTNALAWANFTNSGSAITVRASYNVSSITFTSVYLFTLNFSNALTDTNYVVLGVSGNSGSTSTSGGIGTYTPSGTSYSSKTTSSVALASVAFNNNNPAFFDNNVIVFGN